MKRGTDPKMTGRSLFAEGLRALLDDTEFLTRARWAGLLGVTTAALSQWVNDKTLPRPDLLGMILDLLQTRGGRMAEAALRQFDALMDRPATTISPFGARMGASLRSYTTKKSFLDFARSLQGLDSDDQLAALKSGSWHGGSPQTPQQDTERQFGWPLQVALVRHLKGAASGSILPRMEKEGSNGNPRLQAQWEDLATSRCAVIIGPPGAGKTAALRVLERVASDRNERPAQYALRRGSAADFETWLARILEGGNRTVLIDGLDEMPCEERRASLQYLTDAMREAPSARFLIASRPVAELDRLAGFERFQLVPVTDAQLLAAVANASRGEAAVGVCETERFVTHLYERKALRGLLRDRMSFERAWAMFVQWAITPFWEGEVVAECARALLFRDVEKGFSRIRAPWASPHQLAKLLGQLSLQLMVTGSDDFDRQDTEEWLSDRLPPASHHQFLDLIIATGFIGKKSDRYSFRHDVFREYFAALYCVESTADAAVYLAAWPMQPRCHNVLRFACGISDDAAPLLRSVLDHEAADDDRYPILADILAQPLAADRIILQDCCSRLVSWLDGRVSEWTWQDEDPPSSATLPWRLLVHAKDTRHRLRATAKALEAVHRARSGPASDLIVEHLERATSMFLVQFLATLAVEGRMRIDVESQREDARIRIVIENPALEFGDATTRPAQMDRDQQLADAEPGKVVDIRLGQRLAPGHVASARQGDPNEEFALDLAAASRNRVAGSPDALSANPRSVQLLKPVETASGIGVFNEVDGCVQFVAIGSQPPTRLRLGQVELELKPTSASPNVFALPTVKRAEILKLLRQHNSSPDSRPIEWH